MDVGLQRAAELNLDVFYLDVFFLAEIHIDREERESASEEARRT